MRKRTRNLMIASAAVLAAAIVAFPAAMALVPGSGARYIDEDHYTGEVVTDTAADANGNHGGHSGWVDLNKTNPNQEGYETVTGVSWSGTTCTISATGKYFLSADLDANIVIATDGVTVDLCLAGHALSAGNVSGTSAVLLGDVYAAYNSGTETAVTLNLYDCGYDSVHYYKRGTAHTLLDGTVMYEGYDFSDSTLTAEMSDGYVRGGLITGGNADGNVVASPTSSVKSYGGGVTVAPGCTLNMYGGTIAGNVSGTGGGVTVKGGTFTMYGGTISGNKAEKGSGTYGNDAGGVAVVPQNAINKSYTAYTGAFTMNGGRICDNYAAASAGGVLVVPRYSGAGTFSTNTTTFTMNGGVISGNEASSNGGGVYVAGYSSSGYPVEFKMKGGTIRDNVSGSSGGGVYAANYEVTVTVTDGEITGNRENREYPSSSSVRGGGLCLNSTGTLTISGSPYIYGNYVGGKICNLGLGSGSSYTITLDGLMDGARIGVTKAGASTSSGSSTQITTNYETGVEAYFLSDERTFRVTANGSSYLQLTSG